MKTWAERLDAAEKRGCFTEGDIDRAGSYRTCATSEYRGRFNEFPGGEGIPTGNRLGELSANFTVAVSDQDVNRARLVYEQIRKYFRRKS